MKDLKSNIYLKLGIIGALILLLLIPSAFIQSLIHSRQLSKKQAIHEVSSKQGGPQTITGPYISIPFSRFSKNLQTLEKLKETNDIMHFLPESLEINTEVIPEKKNRGLFEIVTYKSITHLKGEFLMPDPSLLNVKSEDCNFELAVLNLAISDLKGMQNQVILDWNGKEYLFESGLSNTHIERSGLSVPINFLDIKNGKIPFSMNIELKGSNKLLFVPLGKTTKAQMASSWPDPKLTGTFVSDYSNTSEEGFTADWNILHVNRNFPQQWKGQAYKIGNSSFGAEFMITVNSYTKSTRVAKYSILFIALTFLTFFFVEILKKVFIHPIQYFLVGFALVIFYILLLSLSEHIEFNLAYVISSALTIGLISFYTGAILKSRSIAIMLFTLLTILYTFIFVIIQMEIFALLIGSIAIFLILAIVMYFTRNIDWYELKLGKEKIPKIQ